jgi:hypothetical protein
MSSIASVSSGSAASQTYGPPNAKQVQSDFQALASALQNGNLSGAQQAFASLTKDAPGIAQGLSSQGGNNPLSKLASALQSGNLAGAQQAFAALTQPGKSHRSHHHHPGAPAVSGSGSSGSTSAGQTAASPTGATAGLLNALA